MDDVTYTLVEHQKERKRQAYSAKHKVSGAKTRTCRFPSDYLTKKEKKELSGKVMVYEMNVPHTWKEIKIWPEQILKEYIETIEEKFNPPSEEMAAMLGIAKNTWCHYRLEITDKPKKRIQTPEMVMAWNAFLNGEKADEPEEYRQNEPEKEITHMSNNTYESISGLSATIRMTGKPYAVLDAVSKILDKNKCFSFSININEQKDETEIHNENADCCFGEDWE